MVFHDMYKSRHALRLKVDENVGEGQADEEGLVPREL